MLSAMEGTLCALWQASMHFVQLPAFAHFATSIARPHRFGAAAADSFRTMSGTPVSCRKDFLEIMGGLRTPLQMLATQVSHPYGSPNT